jgi:hypothetical protein
VRSGVDKAVQVSRQCRVKIHSGQLTGRDEMRFQPRFAGTFPAQWRLVSQEHDVQHAAAGFGPDRLHNQRDLGRVRRDTGLLEKLAARARGQALALVRGPAGQVPPRAACPGPEENPVDHRPVIGPPATPLLRTGRQEHPQALPFLIGQVMTIQSVRHRTGLHDPASKIHGTHPGGRGRAGAIAGIRRCPPAGYPVVVGAYLVNYTVPGSCIQVARRR